MGYHAVPAIRFDASLEILVLFVGSRGLDFTH